jgi:hypothetical protein
MKKPKNFKVLATSLNSSKIGKSKPSTGYRGGQRPLS